MKIVRYELAYSHAVVRYVCRTEDDFKNAMDRFNLDCSIRETLEIEELPDEGN